MILWKLDMHMWRNEAGIYCVHLSYTTHKNELSYGLCLSITLGPVNLPEQNTGKSFMTVVLATLS